jgi:hypothetical protein
MGCHAEERAAIHDARERLLQDTACVCGASVERPAKSPTGRWALLLLIERFAGGCPPPVLTICADRGLTVRTVDRAGDCHRAVVTA